MLEPTLRRHKTLVDTSRRPVDGRASELALTIARPSAVGTYDAKSHPGFSEIDEQAILRPAPRILHLSQRKVRLILL